MFGLGRDYIVDSNVDVLVCVSSECDAQRIPKVLSLTRCDMRVHVSSEGCLLETKRRIPKT